MSSLVRRHERRNGKRRHQSTQWSRGWPKHRTHHLDDVMYEPTGGPPICHVLSATGRILGSYSKPYEAIARMNAWEQAVAVISGSSVVAHKGGKGGAS